MKFRFTILILFLACNLFGQLNTVGLLEYEDQAMDGYTLIAPLASSNCYLIDNCGHVVNQWNTNRPPGAITYLLDDGRLLRTGRSNGDFSGGGIGGLVEIYSWDGILEWSYDFATSEYHQHHDVEYLPNGNILLILWEHKTQEEALSLGYDGSLSSQGIWPDMIWEIKPVGSNDFELVWEWHVWDHMVQDVNPSLDNFGVIADHPGRVDINATATSGLGSNPDWIHFNAVDYNAELDQIILSSRHLNEIWIIDHSTTTEEARGHIGGRYGKGGDLLYRWGNPANYNRGGIGDQKLFGQHDAHWIESGADQGKIMIFNNGGARNFSSIDIITPETDGYGSYILEDNQAYGPHTLDWSYGEMTGGELFYATRISGAGRLPNGNTLICNGQRGEIFEVTPGFETVWRYQNPVRTNPVEQGTIPNGHSLFRAYKYGLDFGAFEGRDLIPGDPIEFSPSEDDCNILSNIDFNEISNDLEIFPNPTSDILQIRTKFERSLDLILLDSNGRILLEQNNENRLDVSALESGFYIIQIREKRQLLYSEKVLKI